MVVVFLRLAWDMGSEFDNDGRLLSPKNIFKNTWENPKPLRGKSQKYDDCRI